MHRADILNISTLPTLCNKVKDSTAITVPPQQQQQQSDTCNKEFKLYFFFWNHFQVQRQTFLTSNFYELICFISLDS